MGDTKRFELLNSYDGDEMRVVYLIDDGQGNLAIEECSDGLLTQASYGSMGCVRRLSVPLDQLLPVLRAMGAQGEGAKEMLSALFNKQGGRLSDVMDALDAHGVAYQFAAEVGNDAVFRSSLG